MSQDDMKDLERLRRRVSALEDQVERLVSRLDIVERAGHARDVCCECIRKTQEAKIAYVRAHVSRSEGGTSDKRDQ